jgi:hypothetical protein
MGEQKMVLNSEEFIFPKGEINSTNSYLTDPHPNYRVQNN